MRRLKLATPDDAPEPDEVWETQQCECITAGAILFRVELSDKGAIKWHCVVCGAEHEPPPR